MGENGGRPRWLFAERMPAGSGRHRHTAVPVDANVTRCRKFIVMGAIIDGEGVPSHIGETAEC